VGVLQAAAEAGKLGIGVTDPQAKLDVAGLIRTNEGLVFPDGSVQTTAYVASGRSLSKRVGMQRDVQGRGIAELDDKTARAQQSRAEKNSLLGTTGRLAKFDGSGNPTQDALLSESGNNIVHNGQNIQLTAAASNVVDTNLLFLNSTTGTTGILAGNVASYSANNGPFFALRGNAYTQIAGQRGIFTISAGNVAAPDHPHRPEPPAALVIG
jgi:hypothetical protein